MSLNNSQIIDILKADVVMALGCTEPIAVALSVCRAREILGAVPERIELFVSGNIFKNVKDVGIPGSDKTGVMISAGLGAYTGHSRDNLELLKDINTDISALAIKMVEDGKISLKIKENVNKLYIETICYYKEHRTTVIIEKRHNNIVFVEDGDNVIFVAKVEEEDKSESKGEDVGKLSVKRVLEFANSVPIEDINFILKGVDCNMKTAEEGLTNNYGLKIGKSLSKSKEFSYSPIVMQVAGALDARMSGCMLPVMTNSGSGNQGLTIFVSIVKYSQKLNVDKEILTRALIVGNLMPIHIKKQIGPLSALCGLIPASIGAACGILYLKGKPYDDYCSLIKYVIADVSGLFCDGAKPSCALKLVSCLNSAIHGMELTELGVNPVFSHGIVDDDIEQTITNLAVIASEGMDKTDTQILTIMKNACK